MNTPPLTTEQKAYIREHGHKFTRHELAAHLGIKYAAVSKYAWYHKIELKPDPHPNGVKPKTTQPKFKPDFEWAYPDISEYFGKRKAGKWSKGQLNRTR